MKFTREVIASLVLDTRIDPSGKNLYGKCPWCGKDEFGISLEENHLYRCFRGNKCGETGNIYTLLQYLGRMELLGDSSDYRETDVYQKLEKNTFVQGHTEVAVPVIQPPLGWRRVSDDRYLNSRGFTSVQYEKYEIGRTKLLHRMKDYIVFLIKDSHKTKGWVGRVTLSNSELSQVNSELELQGGQLKTRYFNSPNTDFGKLLFGSDEIEGSTRLVIIVEGLFDKINIEIVLGEWLSKNGVVVCCSFGKKLSGEQILKIPDTVSEVSLMYDPDAVESSKKYSLQLRKRFKNVTVCRLLGTRDPGDMSGDECLGIINSRVTYNEYYENTIQRRNLI